MDYRNYTRTFSEDEEDTDTDTKTSDAPDYVFEGFTIELNEKIALTPITATNKE